MKIHCVGCELFHAGERTHMTKLIVAFCKFANAPKNDSSKMHADISILILLHRIKGYRSTTHILADGGHCTL